MGLPPPSSEWNESASRRCSSFTYFATVRYTGRSARRRASWGATLTMSQKRKNGVAARPS